MMTNILRVIPSLCISQGGPVNGLINSSVELNRYGHSIDVACFEAPERYPEIFRELYVFNSHFGKYRYSLDYIKWLRLNVRNYDVVIIHGVWQFHSYITAKYCKLMDVPYFVFTHGMLDPYFDKGNALKAIKKNIYWYLFEGKSVLNSRRVLFTSDIEKDVSSSRFGIPGDLGYVISYGSPKPPESDPVIYKQLYERLGFSLINKRIFCYVGRIDEKKGIDILLQSFARVVDDNNFLLLAGPDDNDYARSLKKLCHELKINDNVIWLGLMDYNQKWCLYRISELFVLASHQENFGIVVSEALSTGTPVLITDKVNIFPDVIDYNCGLVATDTVDSFRKCLEKWISLNSTEIDVYRVNAIQAYNERFSISAAAKELSELIDEL